MNWMRMTAEQQDRPDAVNISVLQITVILSLLFWGGVAKKNISINEAEHANTSAQSELRNEISHYSQHPYMGQAAYFSLSLLLSLRWKSSSSW